jgi:1-acyl-sn-glycerol-3-phosphate acyltransferase
MMWRIRSILFNLTFYPGTFLVFLLTSPLLLGPRSWRRQVPPIWLGLTYFLEKYVLGLDYIVIGQENLPPAPYLVAMKHQSAWETMKLYKLFGNPAIVLKKELMSLPLMGRVAHAMDMVPVDRSKGREATKFMVQAARQILTDKRPLIIFPQGSRIPAGVSRPYKQGIMKLYEELQIPLVPIALNSGKFWARHAFWKHPGTITVQIMKPIPPNLPSDEVFRMMQTQIETASDALL